MLGDHPEKSFPDDCTMEATVTLVNFQGEDMSDPIIIQYKFGIEQRHICVDCLYSARLSAGVPEDEKTKIFLTEPCNSSCDFWKNSTNTTRQIMVAYDNQ
jgi:hypothetical protein